MADKTKTIKNATDEELDNLIRRLRKENELSNLIAEMKRKSVDGYMPYDHQPGISSEVPIESMYHFGVLGMHWGRRKAPNKQTTNSDDHNVKDIMKSKKLNEMSKSEIKKINERIQLEKQFKDLTKKSMSPGKKFVVDLLSNQAKEFAADYVRKQIAKLATRQVA